MEPKLCETCHMTHREDYRTFSEVFQQWMSPNEFLQAVIRDHLEFKRTHKNW